jgi:hypothetical protein
MHSVSQGTLADPCAFAVPTVSGLAITMHAFKARTAFITLAVLVILSLVILFLPQKSFATDGDTVSVEYDFLNQTKNWSGSSRAPAEDNSFKRLRNDYYTAGLQYHFNPSWGVEVYVPYTSRTLDTNIDTPPASDVEGYDHHGLGDVRLLGLYTGFSADMSTGLEYGLKLPTGSYTQSGFFRDTQIGTGSTNALLGAYHRGRFDSSAPYSWSVRGMVNQTLLTRGGYRPGTAVDASVGVTHDPMPVAGSFKVAPALQLLNSFHGRDTGVQADFPDSGNERVLVSPGIEFSYGATKLYTDISVPLYQNVKGNQLEAPVLFQAVASYDF